MSQFGVILALIFSLVIAIFALANNQPIIVNYLYGKTEISAVIVILGAAILGAFVIFLLNMFKQIKTGFQIRSLQSELKESRSQLSELKNERDDLLMQIGQLQNTPDTPEAVNGAQKPSSTVEPYVTGYYMDQSDSVVEEKTKAGNQNEQMDSVHRQADITSEPKVEEDMEDQEPEVWDKKDEKEF